MTDRGWRRSIYLSIVLLVLMVSAARSPVSQAAGMITGSIFRDLNANGVREAAETLGVAGVTVTAYDAANVPQGTATSAADGTYALAATGTGPYRIEFTTLPAGYQPSAQGGSNGSTVQFVPDGNSTNVNLGLNDPAEFCQANPSLCTSQFINGSRNDPTAGGITRSVIAFPYSASGVPPAAPVPTTLATKSATGTVWGLAYARDTKMIYSAAFLRRHAELGPNGLGAIYKTASDGTSTSLFVDLAALGINPGTINAGARGLGAYNASSNDPEAYDKVGKVGLGGMAISTDQRTLWVMNLNDRTLYSIAIDADNNPATMPVAADVAGFAVPDPGCTGGTYRPFAVQYYRNAVYVGVVCDAQISQNVSDLRALVYRFSGGAFAPAPVLSVALNYPKGAAESDLPACPHGWLPWLAAGVVPGPCYISGTDQETTYPQPLLSGIAFDMDGSMMLGLLDRYSAQAGYLNANPSGVENEETIAGGDVLRAYNNSGTFVLESNGVAGPLTGSSNNGQGPGNGEFYQDNSTNVLVHEEVSGGAVASLPGSGQLVITSQATQQAETGGITAYSNTSGQEQRSYLILQGTTGGTFGKAAGLGDLELLCDAAPIEIGNRVWLDTNHNGIQDAGEPPIANVVVGLYTSAGTLIDTVTTDSSGDYVFSSASGADTIGRNYGVNLQPNTAYTLAVLSSNFAAGGALANLAPTTANTAGTSNQDATGATPDLNDSDGVGVAVGSGANAATTGVAFTTGSVGANNHSFDFGFSAAVAIGNQVWYDTDNNGQVGAGEAGVDGVRVELFLDANNDGVLTGAEQTPVAVQTTSSGGYYLFTQATNASGTGTGAALVPGQYLVGVAPSNFATGGVLAGSRSSGTSLSSAGVVSEAAIAANGLTDSNADSADDGVTATSGFYSGGVLSGPLVITAGAEPGGTTPGHFNTIDGTAGGTAIANANVNRTVDFGFYRQTLGNLVFHDSNNNGSYDAGTDTPLAGATVKLFASDGTTEIPVGPDGILGTADDAPGGVVTGAAGTYLFQNLPQGDYRVQVTPPAGYSSSTDIGSSANPNNNTDNDDNGIGNGVSPVMSAAVTLAPGSGGASFPNNLVTPASGTTANPTVDFGFYTLSLGNLVWNDLNNNGRKDASESGIDGVTVNLYIDTDASGTLSAGDTLVGSQATSNGGHYLFTGLAPATYFVQIAGANFAAGGALVGYQSSTGANGAASGPYEPVATVGTTDNDDNGTTGSGGLATAGVTGGIASGPITLAAGTQPTSETDLGMPTGVTDPASNANSNLTIDFGVFQPASLGDFVWIDSNKNGVQDIGEVGVNGVQVSLYTPNGADGIPGNADDILPIASTTTATNGATQGYYHFGNLAPNTTYTVALDRASDFAAGGPLAGYTLTSQNAGGNDATDSDAALIAGVPTIANATTGGPGTDTPTYDFGFSTSASLGDYVWLDANNDGVQDASESGINGVTVHLYDSTGTVLLATTVTVNNGVNDGYYHFPNLQPNTAYVIKLDNPANYAAGGPLANTQLSPVNTTTDTADSDATLVAGVPTIASATTGGPGSDTPTYDIGVYRPSASLGDYVWNDANKNGVQDASEQGINGVTVHLYDSTGTVLITTTTTTANGSLTGYYHFANLLPNTSYVVKLDNPADYAAGGPLANFTLTAADQGGNDATDSDATPVGGYPTISSAPTGGDRSDTPTYDFGFYQPLSLGNLVWNDLNNNGLKDASESGINGVTVQLYMDTNGNGVLDAGDALVASQTTSNGGHYLFTNLGQATYFVALPATNFAAGAPLAGYASSTGRLVAATGPYEPGATTPADNDDNGSASNGGIVSGPIVLAAGTQPTNEPDTTLPTGIVNSAIDANSNLTIDFGVFQPASLGDYVWNDTNRDGVQDSNEPGVPGVTVTLYDSNGNPLATTTTDANGHYLFPNLVPGSYTVGFTNLPGSYIFTTPGQGGDTTRDSNADPSTGRTPPVTLQPGEHNPTIDAGILTAPTAIALASFTATRDGDQVMVRWVTTAEIDTWGFSLYRSADGTRANATRVTPQLIPGRGRGQGGARYSWIDADVRPGATYSYWLVEVELNGSTHEYGPASAGSAPAATHHLFLPIAIY